MQTIRSGWLRRSVGPVAIVLLGAAIDLFMVTRAGAQTAPIQYVAKFVCVPEVGPASTAVIGLGTGITYRTALNVHNPNSVRVTIGKKAAAALTERSPTPGKVSSIVQVILVADQVLLIDCTDIKTLLGGVQPNGDGVVVIFSPPGVLLDVWAVYTSKGLTTAANGDIAQSGNIDVVQVPPQTGAH